MNLILWKGNFLGKIGLYFAGVQNFFGEQRQILLGSKGNYFKGFGEINALFSGSKGAQTHGGLKNSK